ncbi:MAG: putative zinc-binding metallopeptidase [Proteobacteria bacterium]|jgi:hypothetical protein|nr:putative zinc-binding metallopeptidase [Pseudomonadota bacterium]
MCWSIQKQPLRTFECECGNAVFFENTQCVVCQSELGWCPGCRSLAPLVPGNAKGSFSCGRPSCGVALVKCHNYSVESVCNRCVMKADSASEGPVLCDYCRFNDTIPDLTVPDNRGLWRRLELAKRRLLYTLDLIGLPYGTEDDGIEPPLAFDFKADTEKKPRWWWQMGQTERVYTGHASGKITINIVEADSVASEQARVMFEEAHRTPIGHFRHEIGHYYWEMLVLGRRETDFVSLFGDYQNPGYSDALALHYEQGPPADWRSRYISAYATMHPWEDFAETFALYLNMVSVLDTARNMGIGAGVDPTCAELEPMVDHYRHLGVVLNEMNRTMGLMDLVPDVLVDPVVSKLHFVHDLVRAASVRNI